MKIVCFDHKMFKMLNRLHFTSSRYSKCRYFINLLCKRAICHFAAFANDYKSITKQKNALCLPWKCNKCNNAISFTWRMYSSDAPLENERCGPLPIQYFSGRQIENHFEISDNKPSNDTESCDETSYDEDDCFTFDSVFAPIG